MFIPKPSHCNQNWLEMKPIGQGRLCQECQNEILDFSKMRWSEIKQIQEKNNNSVCGMYHPKQLENWGEDIGKPSVFPSKILTTSLILSLTQFTSSDAIGKELIEYHSEDTITTLIDDTSVVDTNVYQISGIVMGKYENGIQEPLIGAKLYLSSRKSGAMANIDGEFVLKTSLTDQEIKNDTLIVEYIGFKSVFIPLSAVINELDNLTITLNEMQNDVIVFYVSKPTLKQRIKWKIRSWFN